MNIFNSAHMHTMEYYSSIKKNEVLSFAAAGIELKAITFSEKDKQIRENASCSHLSVEANIVELLEVESRIGVTRVC
jgi:hypothetical protein